MDKRKQRVFIITLEIREDSWDYKVGDVITSAVISNSINNALYSFEEKHCGSEYPEYIVSYISDTYETGFFMPNIKSNNLL